MKKIGKYILVFILGVIVSYAITVTNFKPEKVIVRQEKEIIKYKYKVKEAQLETKEAQIKEKERYIIRVPYTTIGLTKQFVLGTASGIILKAILL